MRSSGSDGHRDSAVGLGIGLRGGFERPGPCDPPIGVREYPDADLIDDCLGRLDISGRVRPVLYLARDVHIVGEDPPELTE